MSLFIAIAVSSLGLMAPARAALALPTWTPGDYWEYAVSDAQGATGTARLDVVGTETVRVGGVPYAGYRVTMDQKLEYHPPPFAGWLNATGVLWHRTSDLAPIAQYLNGTIEIPPFLMATIKLTGTFDPPQRVEWPLTPGAMWTASGWFNSSSQVDTQPPSWSNTTVTTSFLVEAERSVTVPAGMFATTPLRAASGGWANITHWSSTAGNGVLLQSFDPFGVETIRLELTSFRYQAGTPGNQAPVVVLGSPDGGERWTGPSFHDVVWTMSDADTPGNLIVNIRYSTDGGATFPHSILPDASLSQGPKDFSWMLPATDSSTVRVRVCASDGTRQTCDVSAADFTIDGTDPAVISTNPTNGEIDVPLSAMLRIVFSEPMDQAATEAALTSSPLLSGVTYTWAGEILTIGHNNFEVCTPYTITVGSGAHDVSDPGNPLAAPVSFSFTTTCLTQAPEIVSTDPANGETGVGLRDSIVVVFSEDVDLTKSFTISVSPSPSLPHMVVWDPGGKTVRFFHEGFPACTEHTVTVSHPDLEPSTVPNPWRFTTSCLPTVALTIPSGGEEWSAASQHAVQFTLGDEDASVIVWINLSTDGGSTWRPLSSGTPLPRGPNSVMVALPAMTADASAIVRVTARDSTGLTRFATSPPFTIDGTTPTVSSSVPAAGMMDVSRTAPFTLSFSEAMDVSSTEDAVALSPAAGVLGFSWSETTLTVTHGSLQPNTEYTLTVETGARDTSDPGKSLAIPHIVTFRTSALPRDTSPPVITHTAPSAVYTGVAIPIEALVADTSSAIREVRLLYTPIGGTEQNVSMVAQLLPTGNVVWTFEIPGQSTVGTVEYRILAVDAEGNSASDSYSVTIRTRPGAPPADLASIVLIILLVVVALFTVLYLVMRRRRTEPPTSPPEAPPS